MRNDSLRIADLGKTFERHCQMRMRGMRIAAQRVDDEQVDALKEIDHLISKL